MSVEITFELNPVLAYFPKPSDMLKRRSLSNFHGPRGLQSFGFVGLSCAGFGVVSEPQKSESNVAVPKGKRAGKGRRARALVTV